jgi:hypothetical protein
VAREIPGTRVALRLGRMAIIVTARRESPSGERQAPFAVAGCTVVDGRIVELDLIIDREKLASVTVR